MPWQYDLSRVVPRSLSPHPQVDFASSMPGHDSAGSIVLYLLPNDEGKRKDCPFQKACTPEQVNTIKFHAPTSVTMRPLVLH